LSRTIAQLYEEEIVGLPTRSKGVVIGKKDFSDKGLIALMAKHPELIQRPIFVRSDKTVLGRSPRKC